MNKYLTRNKVYERLEPSKDAKKVYIYCEGEDREVKYFKFFQGFSSNINILPIANKGGKSDPLKLMEQAKVDFIGTDEERAKYILDSIDQHDEVWFVIDTDCWNEGNKIEALRKFCVAQNDKMKSEAWKVAQSNPCFEIWLYYHFFDKKPLDVEVSTYDSMKDFVNNKVPGGFDSRCMPIEIDTAIKNSKQLFSTSCEQPDLYCTELHLLGEVILPFIKGGLERARNKKPIQNPDKA